jgi:hypothetical protein
MKTNAYAYHPRRRAPPTASKSSKSPDIITLGRLSPLGKKGASKTASPPSRKLLAFTRSPVASPPATRFAPSPSPPATRFAPSPSPPATHDYETPEKDAIRDMFARAILEAPDKTKAIYLEKDDGELTRRLLDKGIPATRLQPVNLNHSASCSIMHRTGVKAHTGDIFEILKKQRWGTSRQHVVWLDMEQSTLSDAEIKQLGRVCSISTTVHLTLSTRPFTRLEQLDRATDLLQRFGMRVHSAGYYRKASGIGYMVHVRGVA